MPPLFSLQDSAIYLLLYCSAFHRFSSNLKELIKDNKFAISENSGDEGSNTKGYIIPKKMFKNNFIVRSKPRLIKMTKTDEQKT